MNKVSSAICPTTGNIMYLRGTGWSVPSMPGLWQACPPHHSHLCALSIPSLTEGVAPLLMPEGPCRSPVPPTLWLVSSFLSYCLSLAQCHQCITVFKINNKKIISNKKYPALNAEAGSLVLPRTSFPGKVFNMVPGVGVMWTFTYLLWSLLPAELCPFQNLNTSESDCMWRWVL